MAEDFDPTLYKLGSLCKRDHDWQGTGKSLRFVKGGPHCVECKKVRRDERAKTAFVPTDQPTDPDFDASVFFLGTLCIAGHDHGDGRSLRYIRSNRGCVVCCRPRQREADKKRKATETEEARAKRLAAAKVASEKWRRANAEYVKKRDLARYHALTPAEKFKANRRRRYFVDPEVRRATIQKNVIRNRFRLDTVPGYKEKIRAGERVAKARKLKECPWLRVSNAMRTALRDLVRRRGLGKKAGRSWRKLVGYTAAELVAHIESQFEPWMTWKNYGKRWHIDHVIPVSAFQFTGLDDPLIKKAYALSNLRPMESIANIRKSNRLVLRFG